MNIEAIRAVDPELADIVQREGERQKTTIELIASENFTSAAVMAATGSVLTNKYAEGLPGRRYYGGCEVVDEAETLAIERAKELFGAGHANVQPYSGAIANLAAYTATLKPGDRILGMELPHGGHLTHGSPVTISGTLYEAHHYGIDPETQQLNYDLVRRASEGSSPQAHRGWRERLLPYDRFPGISGHCRRSRRNPDGRYRPHCRHRRNR